MAQPSIIETGHERAYILGGRALFTLESTVTGNRFTYKVEASEPEDGREQVWFVSVLTGPANTDDYSYAGIITPKGEFRMTAKSKVASTAPSMVAFAWMWRRVDRLPPECRVWHSGCCSRCGRELTVPTSIAIGLGPVCAEKAA